MGLFGKAMNLGAIFTEGAPPDIPSQIRAQVNILGSRIMLNTFGTTDYFSYMAVGMVSMVVLFTTMFGGMSIVWDRKLGFLNKVLTTPVARGSVVMAKVLSSVIRALAQATIVLVVAAALGMQFSSSLTPLNVLGAYVAIFLLALGLSSIFVMIGIRSSSWETQMAAMNLLNLPLLFASNSLFPISMMPSWLQWVARLNPVTYGIDAARQFLLYTPNYQSIFFDLLFLSAFAAVFSTIGILISWRYLSR